MHGRFLFLKIFGFIVKLMNCVRCHHTDESHESTENDSLVKRGKCMIPTCHCRQYSDAIKKIDEELL
jgi:recombinational DNA repair protein (RecF pathway)